MSWRDSVSQGGQDDLDRLLQESLPIAQRLLEKNGEFFPFAVSLANSGDTRIVAAYEGSEHPPSTELLNMLYEGLGGQSSQLRGAAVVSDVRIEGPDGDAIRVEVEHREGVAIAVLLPYTIQEKLLAKQVVYGDMRAAGAERRIWPASGATS
jgi:hypothetical protein